MDLLKHTLSPKQGLNELLTAEKCFAIDKLTKLAQQGLKHSRDNNDTCVL